MRFKGVVAALATCCVAAVGVTAPASAGLVTVDETYDWINGNDYDKYHQWSWVESGPTEFIHLGMTNPVENPEECPNGDCGLIVGAGEDATLTAGDTAVYMKTAPGGSDSYIDSVDVGNYVYYENDAFEPDDVHGIYATLAGDPLAIDDFREPKDAESGPDSFTGGSETKAFMFGMVADDDQVLEASKAAYLGNVTLRYGDDVEPDQTIDPLDVPSGWIDETPIDIPVASEDGGLGVKWIVASGPKRNPVAPGQPWYEWIDLDCLGTTSDPCPAETAPGTELTIDPMELEEGPNSVLVGTMDAVLNVSDTNGENIEIKVDSTNPEVALDGSFTSAPGMVLDGPFYSLESDATDGAGTGTSSNSGVVELKILIDDVVIDSDTQACSTENCPLGLDTDIESDDYTNGAHVLKVKATDAVGHVKTETVPFEVDR